MRHLLIVFGFLFLLVHCSCQDPVHTQGKLAGNEDMREVKYFHNTDAVSRNLNRLSDLLLQVKEVNESFLDSMVNSPLFSVSDVMVASLTGDERLDEITLLFLLKAYRNNITGDDYLYNLSCCYSQNPYLLLFVQHFYRISEIDPTTGLLLSDVYEWTKEQPKGSLPKKVLTELEEIEVLSRETR